MSASQKQQPPREDIRRLYVGKDISDVPKPAAILDLAMARRHCDAMLNAVKALGIDFRAHVKTHKTVELAKLQVGEDLQEAKFVVSTVAEIEHLLPMFQELQRNGRQVNILYGIPLPPSQSTRIANLARQLGPGSIAFILDHPSQTAALRRFYDIAGFPGGVFLKVDTGYHRAGLPPHALNQNGLVEQLTRLEAEGLAVLVGLYSHSSLSYNDTTPDQAMGNLVGEINGCVDALNINLKHFPPNKELIISVGASPQVAAVQNLTKRVSLENGAAGDLSRVIQKVQTEQIGGLKIQLELHAGVYSVMDLQQLATNTRTSLGQFHEEIALSVIAEVISVYNNGEREKPEALVAVGTLGLGREPCKSYEGWGIVSPETHNGSCNSGAHLIVDRISQEHSILSWGSKPDGTPAETVPIPLDVGQLVRIYPNHACVTGAMYGYYFVVDSTDAASATKIIDVWVRASGW